MRTSERLAAFDMRLAGCTWEEIGGQLGHDGAAVRADLERAIQRGDRSCGAIKSPLYRQYVSRRYGGSISALARAIGWPYHQLRRQLRGESPMTPELVRAIGLDMASSDSTKED